MEERWYISGPAKMTADALTKKAQDVLSRYVYELLDKLVMLFGWPKAFAHGGAPGYETYSGQWAKKAGFIWQPVEKRSLFVFPANRNKFGNSAFPRRNTNVLSTFMPNKVCIIPGHNSEDIERKAAKLGIEIVMLPDPTTLNYIY